MVMIPSAAHAQKAKKGDFVILTEQDNVVISYRQWTGSDKGAMVEWKAQNNQSDWVRPLVKKRQYTCADGKRTEFDKEKSLSVLKPGESRHGMIRDMEICPGSELKSVDAEIELHQVPERLRKMYE